MVMATAADRGIHNCNTCAAYEPAQLPANRSRPSESGGLSVETNRKRHALSSANVSVQAGTVLRSIESIHRDRRTCSAPLARALSPRFHDAHHQRALPHALGAGLPVMHSSRPCPAGTMG